jgi:hypothetical protein
MNNIDKCNCTVCNIDPETNLITGYGCLELAREEEYDDLPF